MRKKFLIVTLKYLLMPVVEFYGIASKTTPNTFLIMLIPERPKESQFFETILESHTLL